MGKNKKNKMPFVSICTPTYNRRPFIPYTIKCFNHQGYPMDKIEWIIIDDGTDKIEDLVSDISQVKYFKYDEKMSLGKNIEKSKGDIIVYMDDDDYYPPEKVLILLICYYHIQMHFVLEQVKFIYGSNILKMYQFGPYSPNHATAGTFAFKENY